MITSCATGAFPSLVDYTCDYTETERRCFRALLHLSTPTGLRADHSDQTARFSSAPELPPEEIMRHCAVARFCLRHRVPTGAEPSTRRRLAVFRWAPMPGGGHIIAFGTVQQAEHFWCLLLPPCPTCRSAACHYLPGRHLDTDANWRQGADGGRTSTTTIAEVQHRGAGTPAAQTGVPTLKAA